MNILVVTPAPAHSRKGNRVTAVRWARILRGLGHHVTVSQEYSGQRCNLLVALHAGRSAASVDRFRRQHPRVPVIVALTGTDLYDEIGHNPEAQQSLEQAFRLVLLQPLGVNELPAHLRARARVIYQSATKSRQQLTPRKDVFEVVVLGHLRAVKDPFRTAQAARLLPATSRLYVTHLGAALSEEMANEARAEEASNPRYRWLGEVPRWKALRILARSRLLVLTSLMEGGANVISEALAASVPVLATRIAGSIGILGPDYPGYFAVGDTHGLATLLERAEIDTGIYRTLKQRCERLACLVDPARESEAWQHLLNEVASTSKET